MSRQALAARIEQVMPNAPPAVKVEAMKRELARMAPQEQERFRVETERYKTAIDAEIRVWEQENKLREVFEED